MFSPAPLAIIAEIRPPRACSGAAAPGQGVAAVGVDAADFTNFESRRTYEAW